MKESSEKKQTRKSNSIFRSVFIKCDCDSEMLVVRYDGELDMIDLCMYENQRAFKNKMTWLQRFRYIYQVLRYGHPYTDQIILKRQQIEELSGFLNTL